MLVGTDPNCDWRVHGTGIVAHHLELAWFEQSLWVRVLVPRAAPADRFAHDGDGVPILPSRPPRSRFQRIYELSLLVRDRAQTYRHPRT